MLLLLLLLLVSRGRFLLGSSSCLGSGRLLALLPLLSGALRLLGSRSCLGSQRLLALLLSSRHHLLGRRSRLGSQRLLPLLLGGRHHLLGSSSCCLLPVGAALLLCRGSSGSSRSQQPSCSLLRLLNSSNQRKHLRTAICAICTWHRAGPQLMRRGLLPRGGSGGRAGAGTGRGGGGGYRRNCQLDQLLRRLALQIQLQRSLHLCLVRRRQAVGQALPLRTSGVWAARGNAFGQQGVHGVSVAPRQAGPCSPGPAHVGSQQAAQHATQAPDNPATHQLTLARSAARSPRCSSVWPRMI